MGSNGIGKAQLIQRVEGVRPKRDARADFAQCRCTLVGVGFDPSLVQSDSRCEPTDSAANDDGFHQSLTNLP